MLRGCGDGCRDVGMLGCRDAGMWGCRDGCRDAGMQGCGTAAGERHTGFPQGLLWKADTLTMTSQNKEEGEKTFSALQRLLERWSSWQDEVITVPDRRNTQILRPYLQSHALCPSETCRDSHAPGDTMHAQLRV